MKKKNPAFRISAVAACLAVMFSTGIVYLWSVFQQPVVDHYGWPDSAVTMVSSVMLLMYVVGNLIGGFIQDRTSPRFVVLLGAAMFFLGLFSTSLLSAQRPWLIYITYGVVAGLGVGFAYAGALNCCQRWFPHRRGFATGISVCAFGLSAVVLGPMIEGLIARFGVPMTYRILAFTFPVLAAVMGLVVKNPGEEYIAALHLPAAEHRRQFTPKETLRTLEFWAVALSLLFLPAAYMMIIPRIKTLALARGISQGQASLTVALTGVASAAARLIAASASDKFGRAKTIWALTAVTLLASVCMVFAGGWFYTAAVLLIVAGYSGPAGIFPAMCTDSFGTKHAGANYGMAFLFLGISSPLFTFISTAVNRNGAQTGNYSASFLIAACGCVVPLILLPVYDRAKRKRLADGQTDRPGGSERESETE